MEIGVKIDVFPIDGVATDMSKYRRNTTLLKILWRLLYIKRYDVRGLWQNNKVSFIKNCMIRAVSLPLSYSSIQKKIHRLATSYPFSQAKFVEDFVTPWPRDVRCSREAFEEYQDINFEDIVVSIIKGYDEYLTKLYGDYMKLPPMEQRVNHHNFMAFWKDDIA